MGINSHAAGLIVLTAGVGRFRCKAIDSVALFSFILEVDSAARAAFCAATGALPQPSLLQRFSFF
ncbi:MAG: hypothetical protein RH862_17090 [Leptospiraceae bacterium]